MPNFIYGLCVYCLPYLHIELLACLLACFVLLVVPSVPGPTYGFGEFLPMHLAQPLLCKM